MNPITLSVVIPTYNRSPLLRFLLESILEDFSTWPADFELVVIDNASTDETAQMLDDFKRRHPPLIVYRRSENIGMDGNLAACFGAASGIYLWQIGDDEMLFRGAASWVLRFCRSHTFGLLHLAGAALEPGQQGIQRNVAVDTVLEPQAVDSRTMIRRANIFLTFISANVVNRQIVLERSPNFDGLAETDTHLPQLAWIYEVLTCTANHYMLMPPIFAALAGNTGGYRLVNVFGTNLSGITERRLGAVFPEAPRIVSNSALLRLFPPQLMMHWQRSTGNSFQAEDVGATMDRLYSARPYYYALVRPIAHGPRWLATIAFFATRVLNKFDRFFGHRLL